MAVQEEEGGRDGWVGNIPIRRATFRRARHGLTRFVDNQLVLAVIIPVDVERMSIQRPVRVCLNTRVSTGLDGLQ